MLLDVPEIRRTASRLSNPNLSFHTISQNRLTQEIINILSEWWLPDKNSDKDTYNTIFFILSTSISFPYSSPSSFFCSLSLPFFFLYPHPLTSTLSSASSFIPNTSYPPPPILDLHILLCLLSSPYYPFVIFTYLLHLMQSPCTHDHRTAKFINVGRKENGEEYITRNLMICTHHQILFGWSNREEWGGRGM
jgi:hypothetical protein